MRVQSFIGKVTVEGLGQMDDHINHWIGEHNVEPKMVKQSFGYERARESANQEPVVVVTIWY